VGKPLQQRRFADAGNTSHMHHARPVWRKHCVQYAELGFTAYKGLVGLTGKQIGHSLRHGGFPFRVKNLF
jgi:hypothetical protein